MHDAIFAVSSWSGKNYWILCCGGRTNPSLGDPISGRVLQCVGLGMLVMFVGYTRYLLCAATQQGFGMAKHVR